MFLITERTCSAISSILRSVTKTTTTPEFLRSGPRKDWVSCEALCYEKTGSQCLAINSVLLILTVPFTRRVNGRCHRRE